MVLRSIAFCHLWPTKHGVWKYLSLQGHTVHSSGRRIGQKCGDAANELLTFGFFAGLTGLTRLLIASPELIESCLCRFCCLWAGCLMLGRLMHPCFVALRPIYFSLGLSMLFSCLVHQILCQQWDHSFWDRLHLEILTRVHRSHHSQPFHLL